MSSRLLIVANRLPVTVTPQGDGFQIERSAGGLATGLSGPHEQSGGLWIGWPGVPGEDLDDRQSTRLREQLAEQRLVGVTLSADQVRRFYEGFSNGVLWPLFHYQFDQVPALSEHWDAYEEVNRRFAEAVAEHHRPGDTVWVQDYQLMLVPRFIRELVPEARIGFFLHIPFPDFEVFRTLPVRTQVLEGLLGADLVGFHTASYLRHFASSLMHLLGLTPVIDRVQVGEREVRLGAFPMGIDFETFEAVARKPEVEEEVKALRGDGDVQLLVGIDRLDYTKGIPRRLLAFERLLERHPELSERVRLVQVAVPSRTGVEAYQEFRAMVDELIGRIHGAFATPHWVPVHYMYRSLAEDEVVALYRAADVMLVTPIRDGMNLVAKEFIASRVDGDGVLVLSEFAGAASELAEAIHVNPYDIAGTAEAYYRALTTEQDERRSRMRALRERVRNYDVHHWVNSFLEQLRLAGSNERRRLAPRVPTVPPRTLAERVRDAEHLLLLLDYDGTLSPIAPTPELARPSRTLQALLAEIADRPNTTVHIVSGRRRDTLEQWLGVLNVALHAEHGVWTRGPGGRWTTTADLSTPWREPVLAILREVTSRTPGALVEEKSPGLAWHYRMADPEFGAAQANELRVHLAQVLSNEPVEVLQGHKVVEIRPHGINKGTILRPALEAAPEGSTILAIGDDVTDEDLFAALPPDAVAVRVGDGVTRAQFRLAGVAEVHELLAELARAPAYGRA
ncbi:MAG: bifunctional alpha,alpha-trehalose-phosphate synthase (UDP-forming)/trehalose-phosphatase [Gemmatimonadota bacterium]|nr:bifunctional alpha,alpha-trehalose-phosphate synthase (UDP-forming)/trehalose-phosphatase [Gemmatimonadota bacterium]